ncbi:hypothetical protein H7B90_20760 [Cohnella xylanilytica]|uniref:Uncharacterized protein n=1 Tax=Cohnella xylanilytica TaxID=557555 RepID=A0A841U6D1_9BACL|nr:hypothetical protein [Cohnella xylanilytica]MBB6693833.1 hypothetical protein [Cohnella xylanilytica]
MAEPSGVRHRAGMGRHWKAGGSVGGTGDDETSPESTLIGGAIHCADLLSIQ